MRTGKRTSLGFRWSFVEVVAEIVVFFWSSSSVNIRRRIYLHPSAKTSTRT